MMEINFNDILNKRMQRVLLSVKVTTEKIVKKEFNKMKKELVKGVLK